MITLHGVLFGARIASQQEGAVYRVLVEQTPQSAGLAFGMGWNGKIAEADGRVWYVVPYSAELDRAIMDAVDALADLRYARPGYGQLVLFDEATRG